MSRNHYIWRWWDGTGWRASNVDPEGPSAALYMEAAGDMEWCDYYPENARVPRVDPGQACNAGFVKAINMDTEDYRRIVRTQYPPLALDELRAASKPYAPLSMQLPEACSFGDGMVVAYDTSAKPTPEEDEAWRAISTGQPQNPGARDLAGVSTRDLMTELFRRVG